MEILESKRENWGSRGGFILAAIGSAVGLGNLWGFPYKLYSHGGGAFLIPYTIAMIVIGIPMLILEFSLGHYTQRAAPDAFKQGHKKLEIFGWWGIILGFVIITYYPVILAYCFTFLSHSIKGIFTGGQLPWAGQGIEGVKNAKSFFFDKYLGSQPGNALGAIQWNIVWPLIIAWVSMYLCIFKGVRLVSKIVWLTVPLPWLMLLVLTVRGLTLPGCMRGLVYYLDPVWSELAKPTTWRFAFGQVFFSLSLAFGVMITYASFLHRKSDLNNNAAIIGLADFGTSFVAGLAVFATLGAMSFATQQAGNYIPVEKVVDAGPSLVFVAFPYALAQLPYSAWFSFIFFFALITLGLDSAFSITESVLASIVDKTGWRRSIVLPVMSLIGLAFGLIYATAGGLDWLETIDGFINGTWGIAFVGLLECVVLGWLWRIDVLRRHANSRSDWKLGTWWNYMIRIFIPIILSALFMWNLLDDFTSEKGFLIDPEGNWILSNCVGMAVIIAAPILAAVFSFIKSPRSENDHMTIEQNLPAQTKTLGICLFGVSVITMLLVVAATRQVIINKTAADLGLLLTAALSLAIITIILSTYILNRHNTSKTRASWFARWAGLISTVSTGAVIAIYLTRMTAELPKNTDLTPPTNDELNGVSYIIICVVSLLLVGGLGWCFYKAIANNREPETIQHRDEV